MTTANQQLVRLAAAALSRRGLAVSSALRPLEFIRHVSTACRNRKAQLSRLGLWPSIRLAQGSAWQPHQTRSGRTAWKNTQTGEVRYQEKMPGSSNDAGGNAQQQASGRQKASQPQDRAGKAVQKGVAAGPPVQERQRSDQQQKPAGPNLTPEQHGRLTGLLDHYAQHPTHTAKVQQLPDGRWGMVVRDKQTGKVDDRRSRIIPTGGQSAQPAHQQGQQTAQPSSGGKPASRFIAGNQWFADKRFQHADGKHQDSGAAAAAIKQQIRDHITQGGQVILHTDGGRKKVQLDQHLKDSNGNYWGPASTAFDNTGKEGFEFVGGKQPTAGGQAKKPSSTMQPAAGIPAPQKSQQTKPAAPAWAKSMTDQLTRGDSLSDIYGKPRGKPDAHNISDFREGWRMRFIEKAFQRGHRSAEHLHSAYKLAEHITNTGQTGQKLVDELNSALRQHFPVSAKARTDQAKRRASPTPPPTPRPARPSKPTPTQPTATTTRPAQTGQSRSSGSPTTSSRRPTVSGARPQVRRLNADNVHAMLHGGKYPSDRLNRHDSPEHMALLFVEEAFENGHQRKQDVAKAYAIAREAIIDNWHRVGSAKTMSALNDLLDSHFPRRKQRQGGVKMARPWESSDHPRNASGEFVAAAHGAETAKKEEISGRIKDEARKQPKGQQRKHALAQKEPAKKELNTFRRANRVKLFKRLKPIFHSAEQRTIAHIEYTTGVHASKFAHALKGIGRKLANVVAVGDPSQGHEISPRQIRDVLEEQIADAAYAYADPEKAKSDEEYVALERKNSQFADAVEAAIMAHFSDPTDRRLSRGAAGCHRRPV
ncbi:MAG: hypothetical protein JNM56_02930 [Planctomycetia bacterium]|nr:hypothetical protein [Planctomycetia bacterium]